MDTAPIPAPDPIAAPTMVEELSVMVLPVALDIVPGTMPLGYYRALRRYRIMCLRGLRKIPQTHPAFSAFFSPIICSHKIALLRIRVGHYGL